MIKDPKLRRLSCFHSVAPPKIHATPVTDQLQLPGSKENTPFSTSNTVVRSGGRLGGLGSLPNVAEVVSQLAPKRYCCLNSDWVPWGGVPTEESFQRSGPFARSFWNGMMKLKNDEQGTKQYSPRCEVAFVRCPHSLESISESWYTMLPSIVA